MNTVENLYNRLGDHGSRSNDKIGAEVHDNLVRIVNTRTHEVLIEFTEEVPVVPVTKLYV